MTIRRAIEADAAAMAKILGDWVRETGWMPILHSRDEDEWFCGHLIDTTAVWVTGDPVAGFLARDEDGILALYLARSARGQGLGARLLDRARDGCDRLKLWTFQANEGAQRFYRREGFRECCRTNGSGNDELLPDIQFLWERGQP